MIKDISIDKVDGLSLAVTLDYNSTFKTNDWNVYLINKKNVDLEMVFIVSKGFDGDKITATMRHKIKKLPANSGAKIEFMQEEVLALNNEFQVSFFLNNKLYEKTFFIKKNTINDKIVKPIDILNKNGVLVL